MPHVLADRISALANGRSGVTFAKIKSLEGRMPALTPGISGILALQIVGDILAVMTDNLAAQFNIYREFIAPDPEEPADPPIDTAKLAAEENVSKLELLIGFEPVEELLEAAVTVRDHMCVPGDDPARSGDALIATYRHVVEELNLFFGSNIPQAAVDQNTQLAPEYVDLMNAVFPVYIELDFAGAEEGKPRVAFGIEVIMAAAILLAPNGPNTFIKVRGAVPEDVNDDLVLVLVNSDPIPFPVTMQISLNQRGAGSTTFVFNIIHSGVVGEEVAIDPPNKYLSVLLMKTLTGGNTLDSFLVVRKRVRDLPT